MNLSEKKFFIFDLDGVLVNTTEMGLLRFNLILDRLSLPRISTEFLYKIWGNPLAETIELIAKQVGATNVQKEIISQLVPIMSEQMPYRFSEGMLEAIMNLKMFGSYVGLLTNRTNQSLNEICAQVGMNLNLFHIVQSTDHCYHRKPDGRAFGPFINWADMKNISPDQMIYIGDTLEADFAATQNCESKIDFVGIVSGVNTRQEFLEAGIPLCRIINYSKLPQFLMQVVKQKAKGTIFRVPN